MLKRIATSALLVTGMCLMGGNAQAAPVNIPGSFNASVLQKEVDKIDPAINVDPAKGTTDDIPEVQDYYWQIGNGVAEFNYELKDISNGAYSFGIYEYGDLNNQVTIFKSSTTPNEVPSFMKVKIDNGDVYVGTATEKAAHFDESFGYFLTISQGVTLYSDSRLNPSNYDRMLAYAGETASDDLPYGNDLPWYLLAFETSDSGAWDFTDYMVIATGVSPAPEPATVLLLGTGVAGLTGMVRRRKAKNRYNFNK